MTNDKMFDEIGCPEKLKEFKAEVENLKNNDPDLEVKKIAEQIYNEIK